MIIDKVRLKLKTELTIQNTHINRMPNVGIKTGSVELKEKKKPCIFT
jgi:hypothetical protein